jgi:hypothetical protein
MNFLASRRLRPRTSPRRRSCSSLLFHRLDRLDVLGLGNLEGRAEFAGLVAPAGGGSAWRSTAARP